MPVTPDELRKLLRAAPFRPFRLNLADDLVPVPLDAAWWSDVVFGRRVLSGDLFVALATSARAALLCHALAGLDDDTLTFVAEHRALSTKLAGDDAYAFATFASSVKISGGRVVTPGGERSISL